MCVTHEVQNCLELESERKLVALHFAAASFSRSACLASSDAQTIYISLQQC